MSKVRTFNSPFLWVSFRFKNPWAPRKKTPPDDERCPATTTKGTRCKQARQWLGHNQERAAYCSWHAPAPQREPRRDPAPVPATVGDGEGLPEDPAEWLASLAQADTDA